MHGERALDKFQHPLKALNKLGIEGNFLNLVKTIYEKPTSNMILNGERLNDFPLRSEARKGTLYFVLEVPASANRQEKASRLEKNK